MVIEEIESFLPGRSNPFRPVLYDLMLEYPLRAAKALRPALSIACCRALGGRTDAVLPSAAMLEFYHNAFLIHDDIEDGSHARRGGQTLHLEHGVAMAINVGDAMLALSLRPLLQNTSRIGLGKALRVLDVVATMCEASVEGQALELSWIRDRRWNLEDADYLLMAEKKTAWYSFVAPMQIGAIVAGADSTTFDALTEFGRSLGLAFQIQDDILNLEEGRDGYGKELAGDLWEAKRTLILLHVLRSATATEAERAREILNKPRPLPGAATTGTKTSAEVEFLEQLIEKYSSLDYARARAHELAVEARVRAEACRPRMTPSVHWDFIDALVDYVHTRDR